MKLLRGTRVLELDGPFGACCARFLGSLGAEVIKILGPGAEAARDAFQRYEDADKQWITLDLSKPEGGEALRALCARADFLIESEPPTSLTPRGLDYAALSALNPRLIHASITPFGGAGPYAGYRGSELVASAMGGVLRTRCGAERPPQKEALDACIFHAASAACAALMLAFHELRRSGRGQHIDVSLHEVTASRSARALLRWQFERAHEARLAPDDPSDDAPAPIAEAAREALLRWLREVETEQPGEGSFLQPYEGAVMPGPFVGVVPPAPRTASSLRAPERPRDARGVQSFSWDVQRGAPRCGALMGVKVVDLSSGVASALATKALAEHGAQVVKVESSVRPSAEAPWHAHLDTSKLSLRLHLTHARAPDVLTPLLDWADVLIENEGPAVAGFDGARVQARRAELVVARGRPHAAALAGAALLGGCEHASVGAANLGYDDALLASFMVATVAAALAQRRRTGLGCHIQASAHEVCAHQLAPALLAAQQGALDRAHPAGAQRVFLQGVYPARGKDRWIALTLFDADDLARLAELAGGSWPATSALPAATLDPALRASLDARIGDFTRTRDDHALMHALQAHGIAAGVVQDAEDLLARDRQLAGRNALVQLTHPELGRFAHQASPYPLGSSPSSLRTAPLPGQHTEYVCRELLGLDAAAIEALRASELFF